MALPGIPERQSSVQSANWLCMITSRGVGGATAHPGRVRFQQVPAAPCLATARITFGGVVADNRLSDISRARRAKSRPEVVDLLGPFALVRRLVDLGVDNASSPARIRWVQTINVVALCSMLLSAAFAIFYTVLDFSSLWAVIATNLLWIGGYAFGMATNGRGHPRRAAWILLASGWANTLIPGAVLGASTGVYLFLILVPMLGVLLSAPGDRLMHATVIGFGALVFAAVPVWFPRAPETIRGTSVETILFVSSAIVVGAFGSLVALYYRGLVDDAESALAEANERSETLLLNILPAPIAERLKAAEFPIADKAEDVTVLFADLVDSTHLSEQMSADELVALLNRIFSRFDELSEEYGLEKITTIGDAYFAVAGLPVPMPDHIEAAARAALAMRSALRELGPEGTGELGMRFGLCSGPVVAGVIGRRKFRYDLWGDTVNLGSRMQAHGEPGTIHVTSEIYAALRHKYAFEPRGPIEIKGKGMMETYFLLDSRDSGKPRQMIDDTGFRSAAV